MFILDILRHDAMENVPALVSMLNDDSGTTGWRDHWPRDFSNVDVANALIGLLHHGLVSVTEDTSTPGPTMDDAQGAASVDAIWFAITQKGRRTLRSWRPPMRL